MKNSRLSVSVLLITLVGCGSTSSPRDANTSEPTPDGGDAMHADVAIGGGDVAAPKDQAAGIDLATPKDAALGADGEAPNKDAALGPDGAAPKDTAPGADVGAPKDSGSDAVVVADGAANCPSGSTCVNSTGDDTGWASGFADYPMGVEQAWNFAASARSLPAPLAAPQKALFIGGDNHSDDLFMFWKKRIEGLVPNKSYTATFVISFATDAAKGCIGVGGAPGEAVTVKAGLSAVEPKAALDSSGSYQMNIDKGNQGGGGAQAAVLGNVAGTNTDCIHPVWEMKTLKSSAPFVVKAAADGSLWFLVGTDSGYEARTEIYYANIGITLTPQ